jgi:hypothetical protein
MLNPTPTTADHWYNLEETSNSTTFDVFLEQLASNNPNNPNGFEIALQESPGSTFFAPFKLIQQAVMLGFTEYLTVRLTST